MNLPRMIVTMENSQTEMLPRLCDLTVTIAFYTFDLTVYKAVVLLNGTSSEIYSHDCVQIFLTVVFDVERTVTSFSRGFRDKAKPRSVARLEGKLRLVRLLTDSWTLPMSIYVRQVGLIFANKLHIRGSTTSYSVGILTIPEVVFTWSFDRVRVSYTAHHRTFYGPR